jgi:hypothetical protein
MGNCACFVERAGFIGQSRERHAKCHPKVASQKETVMLHTGMDRIDHRYDSDAAYYRDNLCYCLRQLRREETQARSTAREHAKVLAKALHAITLLRCAWRGWHPQQPTQPAPHARR